MPRSSPAGSPSTLMFNAAGRLKGAYPHLEGGSVKYMRFGELAEVEARADELRASTSEWCESTGRRRSRDGGGGARVKEGGRLAALRGVEESTSVRGASDAIHASRP